MIEKFNGLSKGKKVGIIASAFVLLAIISPTPDSANRSQLTNDADQLQNHQTIDTSVKQPIITTETKTVTTTEAIAFESTTRNDSSIEKGRSIKSVTGVLGERTLIYDVKYQDSKEIERKLISSEVTKDPVNELILIGTKEVVQYVVPAPASNCDPNYTPCVPNVSYDLDCPDIGFMVSVIGSDPHRFDRDNDGYGCESYN